MTDTHLLTASNRTKCGIDIDGLFRTPRITSLAEDVTCRQCNPHARPMPKPGSLDALLKAAYDAGVEHENWAMLKQELGDKFTSGEPPTFEEWRLSLLGETD